MPRTRLRLPATTSAVALTLALLPGRAAADSPVPPHTTARVDFPLPTATGGVPARYVKRALERNRAGMLRCYICNAQLDDPLRSGQLDVQLRFGPDGRAQGVKLVSTTLKHPNTEACILGILKTARFGRMRGRTTRVRLTVGLTAGASRGYRCPEPPRTPGIHWLTLGVRKHSNTGGMRRMFTEKYLRFGPLFPALIKCYSRGGFARPELRKGSLDVHYRLRAKRTRGRVRITRARLKDRATRACVRRVFEGWEFPWPPRKAAWVQLRLGLSVLRPLDADTPRGVLWQVSRGLLAQDGPGTARVLRRPDVLRVVRYQRDDYAACLRGIRGPMRRPGRALYKVSFTVGPGGKVTAMRVLTDTLGHAPTARCIQQTVRSWFFPRSSQSTTVSYSFHFM
ncbi:MAG: AgmX/PglI C-terminal domain-containing protein [bacterium]